MKRKKAAFHFWSFTGWRNLLMPKETSYEHSILLECSWDWKMKLYIQHERVDWQDPNLFSNMQAIRKGKNNENVNANLVSRAFSLLTFTSFNVKEKEPQEMKLP